MAYDISHNIDQKNFSVTVQAHPCVLEYELDGTTMTVTHTRVPQAVGGKGIAGALTRVALDSARQNGWRVIPQCSYAAVYIERHPEYADLVA